MSGGFVLTDVLRALVKKKKLEYSSVVATSWFHISTEGENINIRTSMKKMLITAW